MTWNEQKTPVELLYTCVLTCIRTISLLDPSTSLNKSNSCNLKFEIFVYFFDFIVIDTYKNPIVTISMIIIKHRISSSSTCLLLSSPNCRVCLHCELIYRSVRVTESSTNAADEVRAKHVARASVSMHAHEWDHLYSGIKKKPPIPTYLVIIKV